MSILDRFRTLRELCRREYGDEFAEKYDMLNRGEPIGNFEETMAFIEQVEAVKAKYEAQLDAWYECWLKEE